MFIVLDGCDGSGKSTAAKALQKYLLEELHVDALWTRDPGGTPDAEKLRDMLLSSKKDKYTEFFLFQASRANLLHACIIPALEAGKWVIVDRFIPSTFVYQVVDAGVPRSLFDECTAALLAGLPEQPKNFVLEVSFETSQYRLSCRQEQSNHFDITKREVFDRRSHGYNVYAQQTRSVLIDANGSTDSIVQQIVSNLV